MTASSGTGGDGHRFCGSLGHSEEPSTGSLIYMRARWYDSATGTFISEDPAKDGVNWYAYCAGNPVSAVDPSGQHDLFLDVIGAAVEYVLGPAALAVLYTKLAQASTRRIIAAGMKLADDMIVRGTMRYMKGKELVEWGHALDRVGSSFAGGLLVCQGYTDLKSGIASMAAGWSLKSSLMVLVATDVVLGSTGTAILDRF